MEQKPKKFFFLLIFAHIYCLILSYFSGEKKMDYSTQYFFHYLTWWCVWNSLLTIAFACWKLRKPKSNTYFAQVFAFVTMASNLISMAIYGMGIIIWLVTNLTNYWGLTNWIKNKLVPIPNHSISSLKIDEQPAQILRVVRWWFYSPIWHFIAPTFFVVWFFRHVPKNHLRKRLKLTIFASFILPTTYFLYCYLRSRIGDKTYFKAFDARWPYFFLSSKTMVKKLGIGSFRFVWKIILVLFWFSLFGAIVYFSLWIDKKLKKYESYKKLKQRKEKSF